MYLLEERNRCCNLEGPEKRSSGRRGAEVEDNLLCQGWASAGEGSRLVVVGSNLVVEVGSCRRHRSMGLPC